jgi:predicted transcriptional regulator
VAIGLAAGEARPLAVAAGRDLAGRAVPIGLGCRACTRPDCPQRSAPPAGRAMLPESGVTPFGFALD